ncbi:MAG TPA: TIGR03086 family metal-binding protein [Candidatus Nanopelagicaceae bacterium]|jgi:uncharacterized protein (TIGR03086 family)
MAYDRTVFLPIDPNAAFDLVTQPERLRRWCAISARVDLCLGGEFRWTITPGNVALGTVTEIEPGRLVSYAFGWVSDPNLPPGTSKVTITMEPFNNGTNVRLVHEGLTKEQEVDHAEGWDHFLERLVGYATTGKEAADPWNAAPDNLDEIKSADASLVIAQLILQEVKPSDLSKPTPCADFNLQQLIDHQYKTIVDVAESLGIKAPVTPDPSFEVRLADLAQKIVEAFQHRGLGGTLQLGPHTLPANIVANILNIDLLIHALDIAQSIHQEIAVAPALADYVLALSRQTVSPEVRASGAFAEEIPVSDADESLKRLLAFTGRKF